MSIVTLRDWDPTGTYTPTDQRPSKTEEVLSVLGQLVKAGKNYMEKRATSQRNNQYRDAAMQAMKSPGNETEYDYDPATGGYKAKVTPKKNETDMGNFNIRRQIFRNQFGYDPITGEKVQNPVKPKFGYSNDILSQILGGGAADDAGANEPALDMGSPGGGGYLDQDEIDAQNAINAGANPAKVKARLAEIKAAKKANGTV